MSESPAPCDYLQRTGDARRAADCEQLYAEAAEAFRAALERLARAYERHSDKRRDLLQKIHVALWCGLARFDGRCSLRTWVYRVAHNTATEGASTRIRTPTIVTLDDSVEWIAAASSEEQAFDRRRRSSACTI